MRTRTRPGEMLLEEHLKPTGPTADDLAALLRIPESDITDLVAGCSRITLDLADELADYFGGSAQFWINAQSAHDRWMAA
jgi:addiction module HigA family antidote